MLNSDPLPRNVDELTSIATTLREQVIQQSLFIDQLLEQIRLGRHHRFGVKSEHISPDQLRLLLEEAQSQVPEAVSDKEYEKDPESPPARKRKRGRRQLPDYLPRVEIEHSLDEQACQCERCSTALIAFSTKVSEQLEIVPAQVRVLRHTRHSYRCPNCEDAEIKTAPLPTQPIPKSNASPSTLVYLIIAKYLEGMPLFRLER